jgi:hypothetical protein
MQVIRWLLLLAIVGGSTFALLTSYRAVGAADYRAALASGDVTSVSLGAPDGPALRLELNVGSQSNDADRVAWTTGPLPWQRFSTDDVQTTKAYRLAQEAGVPVATPDTPWWLLATAIAYLLVLGTVLFGPQPRRFTRWAAFWWVTMPLGVGAVWLLVREAPWSRTASAMPELLPHGKQKLTAEGDPRFTGGLAFLVTVLVGTVVDMAGSSIWG